MSNDICHKLQGYLAVKFVQGILHTQFLTVTKRLLSTRCKSFLQVRKGRKSLELKMIELTGIEKQGIRGEFLCVDDSH